MISLLMVCTFFFFNDTATTEIYTLSLHDALPIYGEHHRAHRLLRVAAHQADGVPALGERGGVTGIEGGDHLAEGHGHGTDCRRSEEHTSELQSRQYLVCRLLLEKKKKITIHEMKT